MIETTKGNKKNKGQGIISPFHENLKIIRRFEAIRLGQYRGRLDSCGALADARSRLYWAMNWKMSVVAGDSR